MMVGRGAHIALWFSAGVMVTQLLLLVAVVFFLGGEGGVFFCNNILSLEKDFVLITSSLLLSY